MRYADKVKNVFSHGGQNTVNDTLAIGATHHGFGDKVDQPMWTTQNFGSVSGNHVNCEHTRAGQAIPALFAEPPLPSEVRSCAQMFKGNTFNPTQYTLERGTCVTQLVYNPTGPNYCVRACLEHFCRERGLEISTMSVALLTELV